MSLAALWLKKLPHLRWQTNLSYCRNTAESLIAADIVLLLLVTKPLTILNTGPLN